MFSIVGFCAEDEFVVVVFERQRLGHLFIREWPIAKLIVEIVFAILKENANGFLFGLANHWRVNVPAANIDEAADMAEDFAKAIGALPRHGKRANASRAVAADSVQFRIVGDVIGLCDFWQNLCQQKVCIFVASLCRTRSCDWRASASSRDSQALHLWFPDRS